MRELHGKALGFPLGKIDQDAGNVVRFAFEIDAGDDVGPVFLFGKPGGLGIGSGLRQRVDTCTLRVAPRSRSATSCARWVAAELGVSVVTVGRAWRTARLNIAAKRALYLVDPLLEQLRRARIDRGKRADGAPAGCWPRDEPAATRTFASS